MNEKEEDSRVHCTTCDRPLIIILQCQNCHITNYCDINCQRIDWKLRHKNECKPLIREIVTLKDVNYMIAVMPKLFPGGFVNMTRDMEIFTYGNSLPLQLKHHDYVEVRKSEIHGNGVFAKQDLPSNVIFTFYPAHYIYKENGEKGVIYANNHLDDPSKLDHIKENYFPHYRFSIPGGYSLIGDPTLTSKSSLLGHMINDVGGNVFKDIPVDNLKTPSIFRDLLVKYYSTCKENGNCQIRLNSRKTLLSFITTCPVKKDSELLYNYNVFYWIEKEYGDDYSEKYPFIQKAFGEFLTSDDVELKALLSIGFE